MPAPVQKAHRRELCGWDQSSQQSKTSFTNHVNCRLVTLDENCVKYASGTCKQVPSQGVRITIRYSHSQDGKMMHTWEESSQTNYSFTFLRKWITKQKSALLAFQVYNYKTSHPAHKPSTQKYFTKNTISCKESLQMMVSKIRKVKRVDTVPETKELHVQVNSKIQKNRGLKGLDANSYLLWP